MGDAVAAPTTGVVAYSEAKEQRVQCESFIGEDVQTALHCTAPLHGTARHCTALHCTALRYIALLHSVHYVQRRSA